MTSCSESMMCHFKSLYMSTILQKSHSGAIRSQGRVWWASTQFASSSSPCSATQVLCPRIPSRALCCLAHGSTLGFPFKILLGFQSEIKSCFPVKLSLLPFPLSPHICQAKFIPSPSLGTSNGCRYAGSQGHQRAP